MNRADDDTAWRTFEAALAEVLPVLEENDLLIVSIKPRPSYYVQFFGRGDDGMSVEAPSSASIDDPSDLLSGAQQEHLLALGWEGPEETAPNPQAPPGGSATESFFLDVAAPVPAAQVAAPVCATLRHVYGIRQSAEFEYDAFHGAGSGEGIRLPTLRISQLARAPGAE